MPIQHEYRLGIVKSFLLANFLSGPLTDIFRPDVPTVHEPKGSNIKAGAAIISLNVMGK